MIAVPHAMRGRIEFRARPAGMAFFVTPKGERWRIYDCVLRNGRLERVYLESDAASHRVFVASHGRTLVHCRRRRDGFELSPTACASQLAGAQRMPTSLRFDPGDRKSRAAHDHLRLPDAREALRHRRVPHRGA
jgi:hypothetical protein